MSAFKNVRKVGKWKWSSLHSLHSSLSREEPELTMNLWMLQVELLYDFKESFICREKLFIHTYVFIKPRCQALSIYLLSKSSVLHIQIYIIIHIFAGAWGFNLNSLQHCTQLAYSSTRVKEIRSHCHLCFFLMFFFFFLMKHYLLNFHQTNTIFLSLYTVQIRCILIDSKVTEKQNLTIWIFINFILEKNHIKYILIYQGIHSFFNKIQPFLSPHLIHTWHHNQFHSYSLNCT